MQEENKKFALQDFSKERIDEFTKEFSDLCKKYKAFVETVPMFKRKEIGDPFEVSATLIIKEMVDIKEEPKDESAEKTA